MRTAAFALLAQTAHASTPGSALSEDGAGILSRLLGGSDGECQPHMLECITDSSYAAKCPDQCGFWVDVASALRQGDKDSALMDLLFSDKVKQAIGPLLDNKLWDAIKELSSDKCGPCPSISCCVGYPLTVLEALATVAIRSKSDQTQAVFDELVKQSVIPFGTDAKQYYKDTIQFYFNGDRVDAGWINEFLGTIHTYASNGGVHMYRQVPTDASGQPDLNFATDALPAVEGRPVRVGLIADWGCGNGGARKVLEELQKQQPDVVLHLGDTYYSGYKEEQMEYFLGLAQEVLGKDVPLLTIPGNHDYYSGGDGMFAVIDQLAQTQHPKQEASFFSLRGGGWQILGLDTALLDSYQLHEVAAVLPLGDSWKRDHGNTLPFLPDDQLQWALRQIEDADSKGLKTIVLSHHQLFSRRETLGYPNGAAREKAFSNDLKAGTYAESQWRKKASDLPGGLGDDQMPAANTRLLDQFPPEVRSKIAAWYWGHEHGMSIFEPYAGLHRGRLIGNACIPVPKPPLFDQLAATNETVTAADWGGHPGLLPKQLGYGQNFWNLGFVTLELSENQAEAAYFEVEDYFEHGATKFKDAREFFRENLLESIEV